MPTALSAVPPVTAASTRQPRMAPRPRVVVAAIRNVRHDGAALRWAVFEAVPHVDVVQVVHAYSTSTDPIVSAAQASARDIGYLSSWEIVASAVEQGSRLRPDVAIIGSPVGGPVETALTTLSDDATLLVIGDDEASTPGRHVAAHLQQSAHCPVVCVPRGSETFSALPVTVVADELGLSEATLAFAADFAVRHGVTLQVARTWQSLHRPDATPGPLELATEQAELDAELDDLRGAHPTLAIASRIELDDGWLDRIREHSSLVVAGRRSAARLGLQSPLPLPVSPVAFVPESWADTVDRTS